MNEPRIGAAKNPVSTQVREQIRLSDAAFELVLQRPAGLEIAPGQRIRIHAARVDRDYTPISSPKPETIRLCIREVSDGTLSPRLATWAVGSTLQISGPYGYFKFRPAHRPAVFVATGTGIAPFHAFCAAGARPRYLLHGVSKASDLYYWEFLADRAEHYVPCLTREANLPPESFPGRVTAFVGDRLPAGAYDFYLCGGEKMIRDVTWIVDKRFPDARVYSEPFHD